jgi:hypothetical protein
MRSDIVSGGILPEYELPDHTGKLRKLSELQGNETTIRCRNSVRQSEPVGSTRSDLLQLWQGNVRSGKLRSAGHLDG